MNGARSPLVWLGIGIAATGYGTGNQKLLLVGLGLLAVGFIGKERLLSELPPGIRRQVSDALQATQIRSPAIAPGMVAAPTPVTQTAVVEGPDSGRDIVLWF